jgi:hypothetical protein
MSKIPSYLIESIKRKNVVLFLGSGFAFNAVHPESKKAPFGHELSNLISNEFLDGKFKDDPLVFVADLAISETDLFTVQSYIANIFDKFTPNSSHVSYSSFPWKAIFTTNYDLILERSYQKNKNAVQELSKVYRNTPVHQIFKTHNVVPYYKLHGCISYINDINLPLILSTDQYITHKKNRDRLFSKLHELAMDYPFLFVGYSNQDPNIRAILKEIESMEEGRPRSYMVRPGIEDAEARYWESKKITSINLCSEEFIKIVDSEITEKERKLSRYRTDLERTIYKKFQINVKDLVPTESLIYFLDQESEFVHTSISSKNTTPQAFYKGFFQNWDPIIKNLDIERNCKDRILTQVILEDKYQNEKKTFLFIVKGYAGAGKSVLLKRVAWEASNEFDRLCIFMNSNTALKYEPVIELYNYVKERIYIFIDTVIDNEKGIITLIERAEKDNIPITIIGSERTNIWNEDSQLKNYVTEEYSLSYLRPNEIDRLIEKLDKHNSLGFLKNKSDEARKKEFEERAGSVLLVALYEATGGKPFEEIILDEYNQINGEQAKSLYLTVSILHRLGSEARAGLISRVHGINFHEFKEKLFRPLEFIVFSEKNYLIGDFVYKTRHHYIAEIVFETVLKTEQDRYDEYVRILTFLDIDYKSDMNAFLSMTNARKLNEIFNDPIRIRNLYDIAEKQNLNNPKLLQQKAIFEMISKDGSLSKAEQYLKKAYEIIPMDSFISHSLAEVSIKKAEGTINKIEKNIYLNNAKKLCVEIIRKNKFQVHPYHSLLKIAIINLKDTLDENDTPSIESKIKEIEKLLTRTKQQFPDQEFILEIESKFNETINNEPKAIELLERAFSINKATPFIALRYAKTLEKKGKLPDAIKVLSQTLELNPSDKDINFKYAHLLYKLDPNNEHDILHFYRRSFTLGDTRYQAQFWYARALYIFNQIDKARETFDLLSFARVSPDQKKQPRGVVRSHDNILTFEGSIIRKELLFAFVKRDGIGDDIFIYKSNEINNWNDYKFGARVSFNLAFNYKGAIATNTNIVSQIPENI